MAEMVTLPARDRKENAPAPPCGIIYLNLVSKGVSGAPLQAIKFLWEKIAHRGTTQTFIK